MLLSDQWATTSIKQLNMDQGYFGLGEFISLDLDQQDELLSLVDSIRDYINKRGQRRPLNIFVQAEPGSGKSFLVKQVYAVVKQSIAGSIVDLLNFNLSHMESKIDLMKVLRRIQSSNLEGHLPIVFFDEVDSKVGLSDYVFRYFLTPMYEGIIYDEGEEHRMGRGVFFFAASKKLDALINTEEKTTATKQKKPHDKSELTFNGYKDWVEGERKKLEKVTDLLKRGAEQNFPKLTDFLDRIDKFIFLPPPSIMPNNPSQTEQEQAILLASSIILRFFPEVRFIERKVLAILEVCLINNPSRRKVESVILNSTNPIDGTFRLINLPSEFLYRNEKVLKSVPESSVDKIELLY